MFYHLILKLYLFTIELKLKKIVSKTLKECDDKKIHYARRRKIFESVYRKVIGTEIYKYYNRMEYKDEIDKVIEKVLKRSLNKIK